MKLQSQLVEAEAASRTAREETAAELSSLRQRHVTEVDRLKAQFARHHSQSETATLKTNLSSLQVREGWEHCCYVTMTPLVGGL